MQNISNNIYENIENMSTDQQRDVYFYYSRIMFAGFTTQELLKRVYDRMWDECNPPQNNTSKS